MPPTTPNAANSKNNPALDLDEEPEPIQGPPEESDIWEKYNKRMEFPVATVGAVFLHVVVGALLVYVLVGLMDSGEDRSNPPVRFVVVEGSDDFGEGSAGGGGDSTDLVTTSEPFQGATVDPAMPSSIPNAKDTQPNPTLPDTGKLPVPSVSGVGGGKSSHTGDGVGGVGPGGVGTDSTAARGQRWALRFYVRDAKDYLAQLRELGAEITVPLPPDEKQHILIRNLGEPKQHKTVAGDLKTWWQVLPGDDDEMKRLKQMVSLYESRPKYVPEMLGELGVTANARVFRAHFPKSLTDDMARLETKYRNRRPEDIKNTYFRVTMRGGKYEVIVDEQTVK